ncbi:hypothetical protein MMC21_000565 [Puttea exsequens]|nr:hypothetical protein [Puttea exsequens]
MASEVALTHRTQTAKLDVHADFNDFKRHGPKPCMQKIRTASSSAWPSLIRTMTRCFPEDRPELPNVMKCLLENRDFGQLSSPKLPPESYRRRRRPSPLQSASGRISLMHPSLRYLKTERTDQLSLACISVQHPQKPCLLQRLPNPYNSGGIKVVEETKHQQKPKVYSLEKAKNGASGE